MELEKLHFQQCPGDLAALRGLDKEQIPPSCFTRDSESLHVASAQASAELLWHGGAGSHGDTGCAHGEVSGHVISAPTAVHIGPSSSLLLLSNRLKQE